MVFMVMLLLSSCVPPDPDYLLDSTPTSIYLNQPTLEPTPTLTVEGKRFQEVVKHYEKQIVSCIGIETGEYLDSDVALSMLTSLEQDPGLFGNSNFVKPWLWLMDDIEMYCSNIAVEDPPMSLLILNRLFEKSDQEYYQFQRQARLGVENKDMDLILSGFEHRDRAHGYMQEASYYYESLFNLYIEY